MSFHSWYLFHIKSISVLASHRVFRKPYKSYFKIEGAVVEDVRTIFEEMGDESIYIPTLSFAN